MSDSSPSGAGPFLRVEVVTRTGAFDSAGARFSAEAGRLLGREVKLHTLRGYSLAFEEDCGDRARALLEKVLADPVLHEVRILEGSAPVPALPRGVRRVDVVKRAGVMDPVAASVSRALEAVDLPVQAARTYHSYLVSGLDDGAELGRLARRLLANPVVEEIRVDPTEPVPPLSQLPAQPFERCEVPLKGASDAELVGISKRGMLALNLEEMKAIQAHFACEGRDPTDVELETLAQTWSEHCKHKTLTAVVEYADRRYENLLKDTIFQSTRELNLPFCLSVFRDNAGAIEFDDDYAVTFKVETHNHPSALEPYGGAGTGIGGVIRDTMGTGLGARPVLSTDVFCVGPLQLTESDLPEGTLPPRRILQGIVAGVRDYGNRMGIPTSNGAVFVHEDYRANPLVFCGNVGLIPKKYLTKRARPGDRIFVLGGRTGRDGIHGATFSSEGLDTKSEEEAGGAVQIGNPIEEKSLLDACVDARDRELLTAITDCGAGGLSSAVGEMGEHCGAEVELSRVPLKYAGLTPGEIWISEAQERMVLAVPPSCAAELLEVCAIHQVEATDLGRFTDSGRLRLTWTATPVADLSMEFLHEGLPRRTRSAHPPAVARSDEPLPGSLDWENTLLELLASPDITSKEEIVRQYDHEVLAGSAVKPMVGPGAYGPSDACVTAPRLGSRHGIAVGCGLSPTTGDLDPYQMALHSIDEAVRNVVAVGGRFDRIALLDNFAWPSVDDEETLGAVVAACEACRDAALAWRTPFISGKDSLNNQLHAGGEVIRIPYTLLISAITLVDDVTRAITMDLKAPRNALFVVGRTRSGTGGSRIARLLGRAGGRVPEVDLDAARRVHKSLSTAIGEGLVRSCHDLSEGGLAVAAAEMCLAGGIGATITLKTLPRLPEDPANAAAHLFGESPSRYLVEVEQGRMEAFQQRLMGIPHALVGMTEDQPALTISGADGRPLLSTRLQSLTTAFRTGLGI